MSGRPKVTRRVGLAVGALVALVAATRGAPGQELKITLRETTLASVPAPSLQKPWATSPDLRRLAWARSQAGQWQVMLDNRAQATVSDVLDLKFSPDSRRLAIHAVRGDRAVAILDGADVQSFDEILRGSLTFSPDSARIAFFARRVASWFLLIDGTQRDLGRATRPQRLLFSPDGKRLAAIVSRGGTWSILLDETARDYEGLAPQSVIFTPDGKSVAAVVTRHSAQIGLEQIVLIDDKPQKSHGAIAVGPIAFSADGKRWACAIKRRGAAGIEHAVVVDDAVGKAYDAEGIDRLTFSPDSSKLAYVVRRLDDQVVVLDGEEQVRAQQIASPLAFSADAQRLAYVATVPARGSSTPDAVLMVNGQEKARFRHICAPVFSLDGKRLAFGAQQADGRCVLVVDDAQTRCRSLLPDSMIALPSGGFRAIAQSPPTDSVRELLRVDIAVGE